MRIGDIFNSGGISVVNPEAQQKARDEEQSFLPSSWGADTVSISRQARDMQAVQAYEGRQDDEGAKAEAKLDAAAEFKAYLEKKRSRAQGPENLEELLEQLEEEAAEISKKIARVAADTNMGEAERNAQLTALQNQLQQVQSQIGEVRQETLKIEEAEDELELGEKILKGNGALQAGQTERDVLDRIFNAKQGDLDNPEGARNALLFSWISRAR